MLPFTPIRFIKKKQDCPTKKTVSKSERGNSDIPSQESSVDVYREIIGGNNTGKRRIIKSQQTHCYINNVRKEQRWLFQMVGNGKLSAVKKWFKEKCNVRDHNHQDVFIAEDQCTILMHAATSNNDEMFKFLLSKLPYLINAQDCHGFTIFHVISKTNSTSMLGIVNDFLNSRQNEAHTKTNSQNKLYCAVCNYYYTDTNHFDTIDHLFNEKREVPEDIPYFDPSNAGYIMMRKVGWNDADGLGNAQEHNII